MPVNSKDEAVSVISHIMRYQAIYMFLIYLITTWTMFGSRLDAVEIAIAEAKQKDTSNEAILIDVRTRLATIEASLVFIKEAVSR